VLSERAMTFMQHPQVSALGDCNDAFRVLIANPTGDLGGAEQVVLALAERLPAYGVGVSFALLRPGQLAARLEKRGILVHVFPEDYRYRDLGSVRRCIRWLADCVKADGADILHSNLTAHFVGFWAARRVGVPELWHLHDYAHSFDPVHWIQQHLPAGMNLFTTEFLRGGEPKLKNRPGAVVNPNCVDIARLQVTPGDPAVRTRLGIGNAPFFVTIARLQSHKGHSFLLEAAATIARRHKEIKWVIAGTAKGAQQKAYLGELRQQVKALGIEDRVLFPGFVPDEDLVPLLREARALIHPAVTEGYGLVLLEAMACGLPVIAASASGPAEILRDGETGLLVPMRDPGALTAAMLRLIDDSSLADRLRQHAAAYVLRRGVETMVEETLAVYRNMLTTSRKSFPGVAPYSTPQNRLQ
jgi:glycosyltransferase involved in cell wall biosynthesis